MEHTPSRRAELLASTLRRLLRRAARGKLSKLVAKERPEDVAYALRRLTPAEQFQTFQILIADHPQGAADVLTDLEPQQRAAILEQLPIEQVARVLDLVPVDDAVYVVESLPEELKTRVLEIVRLESRFADVQHQLAYREWSAGRIMDTDFLALPQETTAAEAIAQVRRRAHEVEMISYLYVVDAEGRLLGVVSMRQLLLSPPAGTLGQIMTPNLITVTTDAEQEAVAELAERYDLVAVPVVDGDGRLQGIVTVDDILDVFKEEATEDFYKMAGTSDEELLYQERTFKIAGIRLPWILFNLLGLLVAGTVVRHFEETFELALLIGFIPVVMGMAGNVGSQTATLAVRGLATGHLAEAVDQRRNFLWQQVKVGTILAVAVAGVVASLALLFSRGNLDLALAVGGALVVAIELAALNGAVIPLVFQRIGIDPAIASGPLVTTANDVLGSLIYFGVAFAIFRTVTI